MSTPSAPGLHHLAVALATCAALLASQSAIASVAFELIDFNNFQHGQILGDNDLNGGVPNLRVTTATNGVTISGDNENDQRDWIVGFNTFASPTRDSDLEDPFSGPDGRFSTTFDNGNAASHTVNGTVIHPDLVNQDQAGNFPTASRFGTAVIIQEEGVGRDSNNDGILDQRNGVVPADDEGRRPAGTIAFDFDTPITAIGFDLLDIEGPEENDNGGFVATFFTSDGTAIDPVGFGEFTRAGSRFFDPTVRFGNNTANRIDPITVEDLRAFTGNNAIADFTRVVLRLGGSGAIDNLSFATASAIPEASAMLTWLTLGSIGAVFTRRRAA